MFTVTMMMHVRLILATLKAVANILKLNVTTMMLALLIDAIPLADAFTPLSAVMMMTLVQWIVATLTLVVFMKT
jgi:hypothetical protein